MRKILSIIIFNLASISFFAQQPTYDKNSLRDQSEVLRAEINSLNQTLDKNKKETKGSLEIVYAINKKINIRNKLISTLNKEKIALDNEIHSQEIQIEKLKADLSKLRKDYSEVLIKSYKNKSTQNKLLFIISSNNLSQTFKRIEYLKRYSEFQDEKISEIKDKQKEVEKAISKLKNIEKEKDIALSQHSIEVKNLNEEKEEKDRIIEEFKKEQGDIIAQINERKKQREVLNSRIMSIIADEIRIAKQKEAEEKRKAEEARILREKTIEAEKARKAELDRKEAEKIAKEKAKKAIEARNAAEKARRDALKNNNKAKNIEAEATKKLAIKAEKEKSKANEVLAKKSKEAKKREEIAKNKIPDNSSKPDYSYSKSRNSLTASFESKRGRLPWPVNGDIISSFGNNPSVIDSNIIIYNTGIEISTSAGNKAKAVHEGKVSKIISIKGGLLTVLLNHGEYYTSYTNLKSVDVSVGQEVSYGQILGQIFTDNLKGTVLEFSVWKGGTPQNPAYWISNM